MTAPRLCSKTACGRPAVATLTYVYSDSTCVVGPLATSAEPHSYDLCGFHAMRLTPPMGWDLVRLDVDLTAPPPMAGDDLTAVVDAIRDPARPVHRPGAAFRTHPSAEAEATEVARRRHLRVLRSDQGE